MGAGLNMRLLDRYILAQIIRPFLFFLLVFTGIIWLNQALFIINATVESRQSAGFLFQMASLLLPRVLTTTIPISAFAAAVYITNRLYAESELVVVMSSGQSPGRILRPFLVFGISSAVVLALISNFLVPYVETKLQDKRLESAQMSVATFIRGKEFLYPADGVTFFFGEVYPSGDLSEIFIQDISQGSLETIYTAPSGFMLQAEGETKLILVDGVVQQYDRKKNVLQTIRYEQLPYDLSPFFSSQQDRAPIRQEISTPELFRLAKTAEPETAGSYLVEANFRILHAVTLVLIPVLGSVILLIGQFQRTGFVIRIILAILALAFLNSLVGVSSSITGKSPQFWGIMYLSPLVALFLVLGLVALAYNPNVLKRQRGVLRHEPQPEN